MGIIVLGNVLARLLARPQPPPVAASVPAERISQEMERLHQQSALALQELQRVEQHAAAIRAQWRQASRSLWRAVIAQRWFRLARWMRTRSQQWLGTRLAGACLLVGALYLAALVPTASPLAALASVPIAITLAYFLWYWPADPALLEALESWQRALNQRVAHRAALAEQLRRAQEQAEQAAAHYQQLRATLQDYARTREFQAELLCARDWRALRGYDFEQYLVDAFRLHGYQVTHMGGSGDHGVDLIVECQGIRVAIQAKGYESHVSNDAVQQAYSGKDIHGCQACMVITNSRFTRPAQEAASRLGCGLVDGSRLSALVLGQRSLLDFLPQRN